jgi:hypothetical protein
MKRKRGRPPGRKFPQPDNIFKGLWNADFGKLGTSTAMHIVIMCPYREISRIEKLPPKKRSAWDKRALALRKRYLKKWNTEMGQMAGKKIAAGDYTSFREFAAAIEILEDKNQQPHSARRSLALEYKADCDAWGVPFTSKGLGDFYRRRKHKIDSSALSKMYRWAKSALYRKLPAIPRP